MAIVQHDMKLKRSTYEVLQILSISLTDKTHLRDLFDKTNFNDVKDLNDPLVPDDITVRGFIMDSVTGELMEIKAG